VERRRSHDFYSRTQLTRRLLAVSHGTALVTVFTHPGGGTSGHSLSPSITAPTLTALSPGTTAPGVCLHSRDRYQLCGRIDCPVERNDRTPLSSLTQLTASITARCCTADSTVTSSIPPGAVRPRTDLHHLGEQSGAYPLRLSPSSQPPVLCLHLTVTGTTLCRTIVRWNGNDRTTTYVSAPSSRCHHRGRYASSGQHR